MRYRPFHYRVVVEPVELDRRLDRKPFVEAAVQVYSERLQKRIAANPADWERLVGTKNWLVSPKG